MQPESPSPESPSAAALRKDGCSDVIPPSRLAPRAKDERPALTLLVPTHRGAPPLAAQRDALAGLARFEAIVARHGVVPTYAVDHPLAADERQIQPLVELAGRGRAEWAAHLVPALTPPLDGTPPAPLPGNLPRVLERDKLEALLDVLAARAGRRPTVYLAAGGGIGRSSPALLVEAGIEVDASARPGFDLSSDGGPDYRAFPPGPFFYPGVSGLLAVPRTAARLTPFSGRFDALDRLAGRIGVGAARALDVERAGTSTLLRIVSVLRERDVRTFTLVAHLDAFAGADAERVSQRLEAFLAAFLGRLGGRSTTHAALHDEIGRMIERDGPYAKSRR